MEERQMQLEDEINLLDYLIVLAKRKWLIIGVTLSTAIIATIISLKTPPIYSAETRILLPQSQSSASQLLSQFGGMAGLAGGAIGVKTSNDLYIGLLRSRTILDRIIDRFNLMELYKAKHREDTRQAIAGALKAQDDKKSGIITIGVEDKDPKMAADIANAFVEELKNFTQGLAVTEASQRRLFFEEQLKDVKVSLIKAEEDMKSFQEKTGVLQVESQASIVIGAIASLRAQIAAKEVELKVIRTYLTSRNPDLQKTEEALNGMKVELAKLETKGTGHNPDTLMPTGRVPEIGTEYVRKLRDLKFNETLYQLMVQQYEAAKLDEARDAAIIQVIDKAVPPHKRIKPKRRQMVLIAATTGFFMSVFLAFFVEFIKKSSSDPGNKGRMDDLRKYITGHKA